MYLFAHQMNSAQSFPTEKGLGSTTLVLLGPTAGHQGRNIKTPVWLQK